MKIGIGYDIHKLVEGNPLMLGGISIPHSKGLEGYSDADVLLHSICDAILGALGKEDIGIRFPNTDPKYKDISSEELLCNVNDLMERSGFQINNLDCVVIAEEPKLAPYRGEMIGSISKILQVPPDRVNVKAKTSEGIGEVGEGKAIASHAVVLLGEV